MSLSILDGSLNDLRAAIPTLSVGEIELLLDAERNGKTRKGAIALLEEALPPETDSNEVENIIPGSVITLHDGSQLRFGERAVVPPEMAEFMRGRGQVS